MTFSRPRVAVAVALVLLLVLGVAGALVARGGPDDSAAAAAIGTGTRLSGGSVATPGSASPAPSATATPSAARTTATATSAASPSATKRASSSAKATAPAAAVVASSKKGASTWKAEGMRTALGGLGASWFYDWGASPNGVEAPGVEFVPMIWGANSATDATLATAKGNGKVLLGFNEPDLAGQAQMSVEQALDLWPKLQATGLRLGSPAVAYGADTDGGWLDRFMAGAKERDLRVDFIALHWYGGDFRAGPATDQLKTYLAATYAKYHKPIWLTEYALMSFSGGPKYPSASVQADFVTRSTTMLHGLPYLERYAWFSAPTPDQGGDGTGLFRPDGSWTAPGSAYRKAR